MGTPLFVWMYDLFCIYDMLSFGQKSNDDIVVFRLVRESAIGTILDLFSVMADKLIASRTVLYRVEGTIAKQAIDLVGMLMTGVILTIFVFKKFVGRIHKRSWDVRGNGFAASGISIARCRRNRKSTGHILAE